MDAPRRHANIYAASGGLFAVVLGLTSLSAFSQTQLTVLSASRHPVLLLFMIWTFAWPIVVTVTSTAAARRAKGLVALVYFSILAVLGGTLVSMPTEAPLTTGGATLPAWPGESPIRLTLRWLLFNFAPTLLWLAFRRRQVRAIAPLVLSFMTVVSAGILGAIAVSLLYADYAVTAITIVFLTLAACLMSGVLGWRLLVWLRNGYQKRFINDQTLAIDALWLLFTSFYAAVTAFAGPGWAVMPLMGFLLFRAANYAGYRYLRTVARPSKESALLILRVFALGKRSERLFEVVTRQWRYLGGVRLITGLDLAHATIAPHQFLAFLSRKLDRLFIGNDETLERSLANLDFGRDADGRYRINDFFCHSDTWKTVLRRLVEDTDAVLMDLRSFSEKQGGCIFEIQELLNRVALRQVMFVVDRTTDKDTLHQTVTNICAKLPRTSPNFGMKADDLSWFELSSMRSADIARLMKQLCRAASAGRKGIYSSEGISLKVHC